MRITLVNIFNTLKIVSGTWQAINYNNMKNSQGEKTSGTNPNFREYQSPRTQRLSEAQETSRSSERR